eukprot:6430830-Heterocapsa_arctica.AAC.2
MEVLGEIVHAFRAAIIDAHRVSPSNPDYSASEIMMGLGGRRGGAAVAPSLQSFTANRLWDNAQIMKEEEGGRGGAPEEGRARGGPEEVSLSMRNPPALLGSPRRARTGVCLGGPARAQSGVCLGEARINSVARNALLP